MLIGLFIGQFLAVLCFHKLTDDLNLIVEHFLGEAVLNVKSIEVKFLKVECWMLDSMAKATV
mgnify:CR=1 FL=1